MRLAAATLVRGLVATGAAAAGFDELQVFDGRIGDPGSPDLNLHSNAGRHGIRDGQGHCTMACC